MSLLQETVVRTTGSVLQIFLISMKTDAGHEYFLSEVLYRIPEFSPFSNVYCISTHYPDSAKAFEAAFQWVLGFAKKRGETITGIDNPCNCPFLSKTSQQAIVSASGIGVTVLENGK